MPPPQNNPGEGCGVTKGDHRGHIADTELRDESKWKQIWERNKEQIPNPDLIHPGQQLSMPARET